MKNYKAQEFLSMKSNGLDKPSFEWRLFFVSKSFVNCQFCFF